MTAGLHHLNIVRNYIHAYASEDISFVLLAREACASRVYLSRAFAQQFGVPLHVYLNAVRLAHVRGLVLGGMPLAAVAVAAGFSDQAIESALQGAIGLSPDTWLRQMRND